jgi:CBS domain-containing protein
LIKSDSKLRFDGKKQLTDIQQIVQPYPSTISPLTCLSEAVLQMAKTGDRCVLVVEQQRLLGIVTERDLVRLVAKKTKLNCLSIAEVMTKDLIVVNQQEIRDVFQISKRLTQYKIRHLPIVDPENRLAGIITP